MNTLTLTIPAPCDWLNSNDRLHRHAEAALIREWRKAAWVEAMGRRPFTAYNIPVHIVCTVHKTRAGRWDAGNLYPTAKAIVDGLVDAGVLVDDSNQYVTGPDMRAGEKRETACVVVTVQALTPTTSEEIA